MRIPTIGIISFYIITRVQDILNSYKQALYVSKRIGLFLWGVVMLLSYFSVKIVNYSENFGGDDKWQKICMQILKRS